MARRPYLTDQQRANVKRLCAGVGVRVTDAQLDSLHTPESEEQCQDVRLLLSAQRLAVVPVAVLDYLFDIMAVAHHGRHRDRLRGLFHHAWLRRAITTGKLMSGLDRLQSEALLALNLGAEVVRRLVAWRLPIDGPGAVVVPLWAPGCYVYTPLAKLPYADARRLVETYDLNTEVVVVGLGDDGQAVDRVLLAGLGNNEQVRA